MNIQTYVLVLIYNFIFFKVLLFNVWSKNGVYELNHKKGKKPSNLPIRENLVLV